MGEGSRGPNESRLSDAAVSFGTPPPIPAPWGRLITIIIIIIVTICHHRLSTKFFVLSPAERPPYFPCTFPCDFEPPLYFSLLFIFNPKLSPQPKLQPLEMTPEVSALHLTRDDDAVTSNAARLAVMIAAGDRETTTTPGPAAP